MNQQATKNYDYFIPLPMQAVQTEHMVDDLAPQDAAMDALRKAIPFFTQRVSVSEDGLVMTLARRGSKFSENVVDKIRDKVQAEGLPLIVTHDTWDGRPFNNYIIEDFIRIKYVGKI
jgi:hypothetical protein